MEDFLLTIQQNSPCNQQEDHWEWKGKLGNQYSVSDAYCKIMVIGMVKMRKYSSIYGKQKLFQLLRFVLGDL